jgi:hypothetical protein
MATCSKKATGLSILKNSSLKNKRKLLDARLLWASSFTDQKRTKFTALEDMAPVAKTSSKRLAPQLNGQNSREVT